MTPLAAPRPLRARLASAATLAACLLPALAADDALAACEPATPCLEATFPPALVWGPLDAGGAGSVSAEQVVSVSSTNTWGLRIASDLADGRMREWTGSAYVTSAPKVLAAPLTWGLSRIGETAQTPVYTSLSSTGASVVSGQPTTCTATCGSASVGLRYRQPVSYGDVSAGVNDYRIQVSFEASHGF